METMQCPNCGEDLENGAAFCGNCGQAIAPSPDQAALTNAANSEPPAPAEPGTPAATQSETPSTIAQVWDRQAADVSARTRYPGTVAVAASTGIPAYAIPVASEQSREMKAGMSVVLGAIGTVAGLFIPLVGLALGVVGLVLATISRHNLKHRLNLVGTIVSIICILIALASWAYVVAHDPRFNHKVATNNRSNNSSVAAQNVITPCYVVNFASRLNVQNNSGSCSMNAFNGDTLDDSSDAYKIYGTTSSVTAAGFTVLAKQAIENDVHESLPSFTITHEVAGQFAKSPAYFVTASNGTGISVMEAAALHQTGNGDNFFVFVHAVNANSVDLHDLQAGWRWE